jgi:hypothetical protein
MLNSDFRRNGLQLDFLKSALAQVSGSTALGKALVASAEQLIKTSTNASWIDKELMTRYFLEDVGLGAETSHQCAATCVDRGIPSPQRLAMVMQFPDMHGNALRWLDLTESEAVLLRAALLPYVARQAPVSLSVGLTIGTDHIRHTDSTWVDVSTPTSSGASSVAFECVSLASHTAGPSRSSAAPPPSPSTSEDAANAHPAAVNVQEQRQETELLEQMLGKGNDVGATPGGDGAQDEQSLASARIPRPSVLDDCVQVADYSSSSPLLAAERDVCLDRVDCDNGDDADSSAGNGGSVGGAYKEDGGGTSLKQSEHGDLNVSCLSATSVTSSCYCDAHTVEDYEVVTSSSFAFHTVVEDEGAVHVPVREALELRSPNVFC